MTSLKHILEGHCSSVFVKVILMFFPVYVRDDGLMISNNKNLNRRI